MANWNNPAPTSASSESRSSACAGLRSGGHSNSFGITDHSFASSSGTVDDADRHVQALVDRVQP